MASQAMLYIFFVVQHQTNHNFSENCLLDFYCYFLNIYTVITESDFMTNWAESLPF